METSFKNGCKITIPEGVTAIFHSVEDRLGEGFVCGNKGKVAGLLVSVIDNFYKDLDDTEKALLIIAVVDIFQKDPPKNMQIESLTVWKKELEDDDD